LLSHFLRIFKNKKSIIMFFVVVLIPFIDILPLYMEKLKWGTDYHPMIAAYLSGSSEGHIPQIYLLWYLPLYFLILCSDDYIQDVQSGYDKIVISKMGKKSYIRGKLLTSFIVSGGTMFMALLLNMLIVSLLFFGGGYSAGVFETAWPENTLLTFSQGHPYFAYLAFLINTSLFAGLAGCLGASSSLLFPSRKFAYPIAFFIWYIQVTIQGGSIIDITQPFTEYDFNHILPIWIRSFIILISIPIIVYLYKVRSDEV